MNPPAKPPIRWWPALAMAAAAIVAVVLVRVREQVPFQQRNLDTVKVLLLTGALLWIWWTFFSRAPKRLRIGVTLGGVVLIAAFLALFRIRGVSGDLVPIFEPRWTSRSLPRPALESPPPPVPAPDSRARRDFPQFLGPDRNAVLAEPALDTNWTAHPPAILWRQPIGAAWSGFSIVAQRAFTQEQRGDDECVTCYDAITGRLLWLHRDAERYATPIGGEGPRATPTVAEGRVYTLGARGTLNCLDAGNGTRVWSRNIVADASSTVPEWGFAGSPLVIGDVVVVSAGGSRGKSLLAYHVADGQLAWSGGNAAAGYGSPFPATLAGAPQILAFNIGSVSAHDPATGAVLWEHPWSTLGQSVCVPVIVGDNRVLFSSGYGVGSELFEIARQPGGRFDAQRVWRTVRMKAKFANLVARDGFLYGLDDGILACVDLKDGSQRWKEGRHGHGQGLFVGGLFLLMAERGELVLLRPTSDGPNELARFRVFDSKTWNPIALAGDLLLVRNDREAACLRLPLAK